MLACAQITIRDETDIHVGAQPPARPALDQLWLDSSVAPNLLRRWNGVAWEQLGQDVDLSEYYTIEEVNTRFDQTNQEIALKADKTVTDSLGNRVSDAEAKLTVQAGQITSAVTTANTALANYNNLQIGGRNYIIGSNQMIERSDESPGNKWFTNVSLSPSFFEDCKGTPILLSMEIMSEDAVHGEKPSVSVVISYEYEGGEVRQYTWNWQHLAKPGSNPWTRYTGTGAIPADALRVTGFMVTLQGGFTSGYIAIRNPKLERGNKMTAYTKAPEDEEKRLTLAESRITQNANNINLRVSTSLYNNEKVYRSSVAPASPAVNMLWLNTGASPYLLNRWTGSAWVAVGADKVVASGINITSNDITMKTTNFILQLLDKNNPENVLMDMRADGNVGFKQLSAEQVVSPSVVEAYAGSIYLYVNPSYVGTAPNHFKSLREVCEFLSGKYLRETVYINFVNSNVENIYENAGITLRGVCGPGRIWFFMGGKNKTVIGNLYIDSCSVAIFIDGLNIRESRPLTGGSRNFAVVYAHHCTHVTLQHVIINGNNTSDAAFRADYTNASLWDGVLRNVNTGFHMNSDIGVLESTTGTLPNAMLCNASIIFCVGVVPSGSRVTYKNGVIYASGISMGGNTNPATVTTERTATFTATLTRSYRSGVWRTDAYDMVQGAYSGAGYSSSVGWNYGCCWFGSLRSALSGRTVRSATLTITRSTGSGSGGSVAMYLYGITNATNNGMPSLAYSVGVVGTIGRGQTLQINLPVALVQGLANGTYGGLCLYETPYNFGRSAYSSNYSRYNAPTLYVVYQ